ncbi:MAG: glycosyltransferase family 4 protein [Pseudomonadota bacterium]
MRVLLYADAMNPDLPSEPGVIFNTARSLVDQVDEAVVVTQIRNREAIDRAGFSHAEIVYLDTEYIARPVWKISSALRLNTANLAAVKYPVQFAFERELWKRFGSDLKTGRFDILHRVGPISSALPSPLARWSPVPFVIGPVNGGLQYPESFKDVMRREGEWLRYIRNSYKILPYARTTYTQAAAILAAFDHTIETLPAGNEDRIFDFPEVGADPDVFGSNAEIRHSTAERLTFLFAGRLVPFKCADVAVQAFAQSPLLQKHRLVIAGDGPERSALEQLVARHSLQECVEFLGWTEKHVVAQYMQSANVFVFPSIRDAGAGVIAEAMMAGLPSVVVGYGPGRHLLDDRSGIRVPLGTRGDHIEGFKTAMETLAQDKDLCAAMGHAARLRALENLTWDVRAQRIAEVYRWVTGACDKRPAGLLR